MEDKIALYVLEQNKTWTCLLFTSNIFLSLIKKVFIDSKNVFYKFPILSESDPFYDYLFKYCDSSFCGESRKKSVKELLTAVAISASVERLFSTYGLVQTKLRNKLGNEKAGKFFCIQNPKFCALKVKKNWMSCVHFYKKLLKFKEV